jgi:two-component system sensor histidine kinase ChiS
MRRVGSFLVAFVLSFTFCEPIHAYSNGAPQKMVFETFETPFELSGEWEFYWNQLLRPEDFSAVEKKGEKIVVPHSWRSMDSRETGVATYRLLVSLPKVYGNISVHFPAIQSATKIWVNGVLSDSSGNIGQLGDYKSQIRSSTISLDATSGRLEIIIQVANYTAFVGGVTHAPYIQQTSALARSINTRHGVQNCMIGILIALCVYQAILFFLHREDKSFIILAVICILVAVRSSLTPGESQLLSEFFPHIESDLWIKVRYLAAYSTLFLFPLYIRFLFAGFAAKWPLNVYFFIASLLCAITLTTSNLVYGYFLDLYHGLMLTTFIYAILTVTKAFRKGNEEAKLILFGVLMCFPFIFLEMMQNSQLVKLQSRIPFLTEIGLLILLVFQVVLLSSRHATQYLALKAMNQNLEFIVQERTTELVKANRIKDRLLSIVSHDIKGPLNSLKSLLGLFSGKNISQLELIEMIRLLEGELGKTRLLVENILSWTSEQLRGVEVKKESFDLLRLLEFNIQLFEYALEKKQISICHDLINNLQIVTDQGILNTVIRNLLSNAIKFTPMHGKISIGVSSDKSKLSLAIQDSGVGMDQETLQSLMSLKNGVSKIGTANERGTGLGILLCQELLKKIDGDLKIESKINRGSTFSIAIPM